MPMPSCPSTTGLNGSFSRPAIITSEWQIPQASMRTKASPGPGSARVRSVIAIGPRGPVSVAAYIIRQYSSTAFRYDGVSVPMKPVPVNEQRSLVDRLMQACGGSYTPEQRRRYFISGPQWAAAYEGQALF